MLGIHDLGLFIVSGLLLNVTPGPDNAYITARSLQLGWRGGAVAAIGIGCGCLVHVLATAVGLSALLAASATAFTAVKLIGGAYLCYIGVRMVLARDGGADAARPTLRQVRLRQVFWQGALTNILNPKIALFFLAFLPQFVDTGAPHPSLALLVLGVIFVANGMLWCLGVAAFAATAARRMQRSGNLMRWINRGIGALFVYLGIRVALMDGR
ncbi:MAG: LysE family translocator [Xanthobacteraceae bacterium]|nr:LysE family translocator [Xanthobacteraceae bacterium]